MIRKVRTEDADEIVEIYNYYIKKTITTFEIKEATKDIMISRIKKIVKDYPFIVFEKNNKVIGYAYAAKWRERDAYNGVVESSVYLDKNHIGKGIGEKLYKELIKQIFAKEYYSIIGVISLPNKASIKLHEKLGFREVGVFKKAGYKFNKYLDVYFCELLKN